MAICTHSCILCFSMISWFCCRFSTNIFQVRRWSISCWSDFHESQIFVENMPHWQLEQAKFFVSHMSWHLLLHTHLSENQLCHDMITYHSPSKLFFVIHVLESTISLPYPSRLHVHLFLWIAYIPFSSFLPSFSIPVFLLNKTYSVSMITFPCFPCPTDPHCLTVSSFHL